jgi:hypothetical protein
VGIQRTPKRVISALLGIAATLASAAALTGEAGVFRGRPAFSPAEQPATAPGHCRDLRSMSAGLPQLETRIDLTLVGEITAIQTDGALWYIVVCSVPDVQVMCITYESNGMKRGDNVLIRGAYSRVDLDHVALDPCLASAS